MDVEPQNSSTDSRARIIAIAIAVVALAWSRPAIAADSTITVGRSACELLVRHVPAPDVAYQPGVDVAGRPVAPADLDGGWSLTLPEQVQIFISRELEEQQGLPPSSPLFSADALIGEARVDLRDGRVTFNGQDLTPVEEQVLAAQCRAAMRPR